MRTLLIAVLAVSVAALAGCKTNAELQAEADTIFDQKCRSYGAKPGTNAYIQCRVMVEQDANARSARMSAAGQAVGMQMMTGNRQRVNCTSQVFVGTLQTSCY